VKNQTSLATMLATESLIWWTASLRPLKAEGR